jgi:transcriptional regulator with XRE-family HTH domain
MRVECLRMPSKDDELAELGRRVRKRRKELGLTQEKLAEKAGMHRTYISKIENGRQNIASRNLMRLAAALDLDASDLIRDLGGY